VRVYILAFSASPTKGENTAAPDTAKKEALEVVAIAFRQNRKEK
jgi:hypothetical protein